MAKDLFFEIKCDNFVKVAAQNICDNVSTFDDFFFILLRKAIVWIFFIGLTHDK